MSQADLNIDNVSRSLFRAEVNASLQALASLNAGATAPSTTYAYQLWADTTTGILKMRNAANTAWNTLFKMDVSDLVKIGANSTITSLSGLTTPLSESQGGTGTSAGNFNFKNRIINGAMMIDQRNAGASVTNAVSGGAYVLDRWNYIATQASKFTMQQNAGSVTPPAGFTNYFGITSSSAYSIVSGDYFGINQQIEGFNSADLAWGTASASTVTLSFWVRSSLTGTFGGSIQNSARNRSYPFTYTISSANTWEQKTITIAGDTSGTWVGATNGIGIRVYLGIGVGSTYSGTAGAWAGSDFRGATGATSVVGTNGATFYITGVQLEKGSNATSFDYRPYGQELSLCQRYFLGIKNDGANNLLVATSAIASSSTSAGCMINLPVEMRTQPSISGTSLALADTANPVTNVASIALRTDLATTKAIYFGADVASGLTAHRPYYLRFQAASSGSFNISAEL